MLSRTLRKALLDAKPQLPPTFLLPWTAGLTTVSHTSDSASQPPPSMAASRTQQHAESSSSPRSKPSNPSSKSSEPVSEPSEMPKLPTPGPRSGAASPPPLSTSVRELLPLLQTQKPHYITVQIHGKSYLVTQGDIIRLPFFMHGVEPGDILRLNRATHLGSRDFTLKAAAPPPKLKSPTRSTTGVVDSTTGDLASHSMVMPEGALAATPNTTYAPHFIPHIAKGKHSYLDESLFVCRAVVMGAESEPLRIKEKTKQRQRHVKRVKTKLRFTVIKIRELRVKTIEEIESEGDQSN